MQHCLQTTSTATTLSASAVRGDGGDILCGEKKMQNTPLPSRESFPRKQAGMTTLPQLSPQHPPAAPCHQPAQEPGSGTTNALWSEDIHEYIKGWTPTAFNTPEAKIPTSLKPGICSVSEEIEGAWCNFQSANADASCDSSTKFGTIPHAVGRTALLLSHRLKPRQTQHF